MRPQVTEKEFATVKKMILTDRYDNVGEFEEVNLAVIFATVKVQPSAKALRELLEVEIPIVGCQLSTAVAMTFGIDTKDPHWKQDLIIGRVSSKEATTILLTRIEDHIVRSLVAKLPDPTSPIHSGTKIAELSTFYETK